MAEDQGTINDDIGDPSQPEPAQSGDLISTMDMAIPVQDEKPSEETKKTKETDGGDKGGEDKKIEEELKVEEQKADDLKAAETAKADDVRFDKHPRFQELISGNRAMKAQIAQQAEQIEALQEIPEKKETAYKDMGAMPKEELTEMIEEDPQGFARNLALQIRSEVREEVLSEVQDEIAANKETADRKSIEKTYTKYSQDHSDFDKMWDSGKLQSYMDENPGHNAISAHMALTKEVDAQSKIDEAVAKAVKETESKSTKSLKAKKNAQVLGGGPSSTGRAVDQMPVELKDTKKYGGLATVLAARSLARSTQAS